MTTIARTFLVGIATVSLTVSGVGVASAQSSELLGSIGGSVGSSEAQAPKTIEGRLQAAAEQHIRAVGHTLSPSARQLAQDYADRAVRGELQFVGGVRYAIRGEGGFGSVTRIPRDVAEDVIAELSAPTPPALLKVNGGAAVASDEEALYLAEFYHG